MKIILSFITLLILSCSSGTIENNKISTLDISILGTEKDINDLKYLSGSIKPIDTKIEYSYKNIMKVIQTYDKSVTKSQLQKTLSIHHKKFFKDIDVWRDSEKHVSISLEKNDTGNQQVRYTWTIHYD